jgi:hypothetical protein
MFTEIKLTQNDVLIITLTNPNIPEDVLSKIATKVKDATGVEPIVVSGKDSLQLTKISA